MKRYWSEYTSQEFSSLTAQDLIAVLPVGAIEQHGPHLPLCVDTAIVNGLIERVVAVLPDELPVVFLPTQPVGKSNEHLQFAGTLSLSAQTLTALWSDIGACVAHAGVRKIILLNSHGGQISIMDTVVRELRINHDMLAFSVNWFGLGMPEGMYSHDELRHGIHAGDMETSVMLALHPELVGMENAADFKPATMRLEQDYKTISLTGGAKPGWQAQDMHPQGACGNASIATAAKGDKTLDHAVARLLDVFKDVHRMPFDFLSQKPAW